MTKENRPYLWVPSLYFTEGLPYILTIAVSVIMYKQIGLSNAEIGLYTSWLYLPWVIKPLWSPIVEKYFTQRKWFIAMQLVIASALVGIGLVLPGAHAILLSLMFFWIIAMSSATHDIAADGYYMVALNESKQACYLGLRSTFYRLAMVTGQGGLVIFAGYLEHRLNNNHLAWQYTMILAGCIMFLLCTVNAFSTQEHKTHIAEQSVQLKEIFSSFFRKEKMALAILFILLFRLGESQLVKMASPFLLDTREAGGLAMSTTAVGTIYGTVGVIFLSLGGIIGGILISKDGLRRWMLPMLLALNVPNALYVFLAYGQWDAIWMVTGVVIIEQFGYGFGFAAFLMFLIYVARGTFKTAHYALATGFMALGMMVPGMISGYVQEYLGYTGFFIWVVITALPAFIILRYIQYPEDFGKRTDNE